ncbi:hypothetical protein CCYA_CCYA02G0527 [Cyanidiococcus yangmingshanensis]|nr:hypothetical protein CCYA_CCYA02G0527 [Cyanidiococcus yangmingshanensis]
MLGARTGRAFDAQAFISVPVRAAHSLVRSQNAERRSVRHLFRSGIGGSGVTSTGLIEPERDLCCSRDRASTSPRRNSFEGQPRRPNTSSFAFLTSRLGERLPWRPKQSLGQNFLQDRAVADAIVAAVRACEPTELVEIGTGTGVLTEPLLEFFPQLLSLDIDERAVQYTRARLAESGHFPRKQLSELQARIQKADFLRLEWMSMYGPRTESAPQITLVGNLPYYIVSPILFHCFEHVHRYHQAVFMVQREFAERLAAPTRCKDYGVLSVLAQLHAEMQTLFQVPRTAFCPVPKVDSVVIRFDFRSLPQADSLSDQAYQSDLSVALRQVVRQAFQQRRKTLRNTLGDTVPTRWRHCRPEELQPSDFLELTLSLLREGAQMPLNELRSPA